MENLLRDLKLEANACLPGISLYRVEPRVSVEAHHARVKLFDDVVEVHFCGVLSVASIAGEGAAAVRELGNGVFPENFEFADSHFFRNEKRCKAVRSLALCKVHVITA